MCGIAGIFRARRDGGGPPGGGEGGEATRRGDWELVREMVRRLAHRGPDGQGVEQVGGATLGASRLSLLDREHGAQPASFAGGGLAGSTAASPPRRTVLVYNGEIYNHAELRQRLAGRGARFRGRCDTEVLLQALVLVGPRSAEELEGMYAFATSDGERLLLGRDPFGIKPLYYALLEDGRRLLFASELKALLADPALPRRIDRSAFFDQAVFGFYLPHKTPFAAVRELPPATVMTVTTGVDGRLRLEIEGHSRPPDRGDMAAAGGGEGEGGEADGESAAALAALLRRSVAEQRVADHPVGVYLSGGLDSTLLATLMVEQSAGAPVHTFATADIGDHPDLTMARRVAAALGCRHEEWLVSARLLLARLPAAVVALESTGVSTIAEMAAPRLRAHVKAALCGDGADELFAGYVMHARPERWLGLCLERYNGLAGSQEVADCDAADARDALRRLAGEAGADEDGGTLRERFYRFFLDGQLTSGHLRRWDLGTMAHGLELRVPYLSRALRDFALALPWHQRIRGRRTKFALRQVARQVLPPLLGRDLAEEVIERRKLAAPGAYRRQVEVVERALRRFLPPADRRSASAPPHPLAPFAPSALERTVTDLFLLAFVGHGGSLPPDFELVDLYSRHRLRLAEARAAAVG